ncbi:MAG: phosphodiester glycosidase family protein [Treponema sp.]|nr:phosphodiester glycosidase family protein [Treponema sp.]
MPASLILFFSALFFSCASLSQSSSEDLSALQEKLSLESSYIPSRFEWSPLCRGIDTFRFEDRDLPLVYHVVRIDLSEPTLSLACVKGSVSFAARKSCVRVAFNATQFESKFLVFNRLKGVFRMDGEEVSLPVEKYAALLFESSLKNGACGEGFRASIVGNQTEEALLGWKNAVGGFFVVLKDGQVCQFKVQSLRARVGVGLSGNAKTMYVLVVEENNSCGLSYGHCALLFKALGCSDAMEFDGGHSTALYIDGKSVLLGYPWRKSLNAIVVVSNE